MKEGGGSGTFESQIEKLRNQFIGNNKGEHPGIYIESVGNYAQRILNKNKGGSGRTNGITYEFKSSKQLIDKVGLTKDKGTGRIRLSLGVKGDNSNTKYLSNTNGLCVLSVSSKNNDGKVLDILVGFYAENGKDWKGEVLGGPEVGKSFILNDKSDKLVGGYEDWCERRASGFDQEQNLVVGAPINALDSRVEWDGWTSQVNKIIYSQGKSKPAFVGKTLEEDRDPWFNRICATKLGETDCDRRVWPVVLGVVSYKKFGDRGFENSKTGEEFSDIVWGDEDVAVIESERTKRNIEKVMKRSRWGREIVDWEATKKKLKTKDQREPLGVKFSNVKVIRLHRSQKNNIDS